MAKRARVSRVDSLAPQVLEIGLTMVEPARLDFRAGQFITVLIDPARVPPDPAVAGPPDAPVVLPVDAERRALTPIKRAYSLASSPGDDPELELLVKLVPDGPGSYYFAQLAVGDEVDFIGPSGFFTLLPEHPGDVVFAATGSGIAPVVPLVHELLEQPDLGGRVLLYWGLRQEHDIYWRDRLEALQARSPRFQYEICLSRPGTGWAGATGWLQHELVAAFPELRSPVFYLVGNGAMVREVLHELQARGVDRRKHIRREVFYPSTEP